MVRLRDSWPFSLSSAPTVGNPCRPLQPESVSRSTQRPDARPRTTRMTPMTTPTLPIDRLQSRLRSVLSQAKQEYELHDEIRTFNDDFPEHLCRPSSNVVITRGGRKRRSAVVRP